MKDYGILPEDIWNMDETGFQIGVGSNQLVVTKRNRRHHLPLHENRERCTSVEAICADGSYIPAFLIPTGIVHKSTWYSEAVGLDPRTAIQPTPTGYSNDDVALNWIHHFNRHARSKGVWRLLLMDRFGPHHTKEFVEYCEDNNIVPFGFPPKLTHLLQPLDVVVFQPLKHYHRKAIEVMVRDGLAGSITKLEFFSMVEEIRRQAFKETTIKSAFKKAGIHPFRPQPIIDEVKERVADRTPSPQRKDPALSSSPFSTPLTHRQIYKISVSIEDELEAVEETHKELAKHVRTLIKGAQHNTAEMIQTKKDLGRTQYAEKLQKNRKSTRRQYLQQGGMLLAEDARRMVTDREKTAIEKAEKALTLAKRKEAAAAKRAEIAAQNALHNTSSQDD